jgi:allantoicase
MDHLLVKRGQRAESKVKAFKGHLSPLQNGGKVLFATDEWFAAAENLVKVSFCGDQNYIAPVSSGSAGLLA